MTTHPFDAVTWTSLAQRQSAKWRVYPPDVLPVWIAEMDYPLEPAIRRALTAAIAADDCGYAHAGDLPAAFAAWAGEVFRWPIAPADVVLVVDVVTAIGELLRVTTREGDGVVIDPPVYPPFAATVTELGRRVIEAPLARADRGFRFDLDAIAAAYAAGARVHIVCSPHNPTGHVASRAELAAIAALAERHDVLVLSDEIHAPLTLPGTAHCPFPLASEAAARRSIVLASASKTWNLAGLKAALVIAGSAETRRVLSSLPPATPFHAGLLGVIAGAVAFREGEAWRQSVLAILDRNRALLADLLQAELPEVGYVPPEAGYLAWLDCRRLGLGDDPARAFLDAGRVALSSGPSFGPGGAGFARLNFATSAALLTEAVERMKKAVRA